MFEWYEKKTPDFEDYDQLGAVELFLLLL